MQEDIERFIQWIRMKSPQAKTWRDYQCDLKLFNEITGGQMIESIHVRDVDAFINYQVDQGFKPSTINRRLAAVTSFYLFLIREGRQVNCPVLPKRHHLREPQRLPRPVSESELHAFFRAIYDIRDKAMFVLMLRCGLRIGEVSSLLFSNLMLEESPPSMIIQGKGSRERTVYLSPETVRCLKEWLSIRPSVKDAHVFVSYQHKKLSTTSISLRVRYVCEVSQVNLTAHRLRHTFADHLLTAGMPITSIQKLMGHRFINTTQIYAVANDKQVQADFYKASERIEGWTLFLKAAQVKGPVDEAVQRSLNLFQFNKAPTSEKDILIKVPMPARFADLPSILVSHLESYRDWKANRWRNERTLVNSLLYYSQQGTMWEFFVHTCGVCSVSDLHIEHVLQFVKTRLDLGRSAKTVNGSLSALRSFLFFLKEDGECIHPSLEHIQRLKEDECLPRYMTLDQVRKLKNEIERRVQQVSGLDTLRDALMIRSVFYLLWQGGLRLGELEALTFTDFYISNQDQVKRLFVRDGKWRKGRAVYLTEVSLNALQEYLAVRGMEPVDGLVFTRDGAPLRRGFLCQRIKRIGRDVDVFVTPHRLRHTFATQLLNVGCRVTSIQKIMGHTSVDTTMGYARAFDQTVIADFLSAVSELEGRSDGAWSSLGSKD